MRCVAAWTLQRDSALCAAATCCMCRQLPKWHERLRLMDMRGVWEVVDFISSRHDKLYVKERAHELIHVANYVRNLPEHTQPVPMQQD